MCGRFAQQRPSSELAEIFGAEDLAGLETARYNVAPTDEAVVIVEREERRAAVAYRWGLIPHWAKDPRIGNRMFNARAETLATSPAFRDALGRRRCIVPVDAFYEWQRIGKSKQPYAIEAAAGRPLALAGLWAGWRDEETGELRRTFTIVTTTPNDTMAPIHDRMPAILAPEDWDRWLGREPAETSELLALLGAPSEGGLRLHPVSRLVNDVRNDGPALLAPITREPDPAEA
jgi:putative SOS response-associated peptidase YedK